jgi:hypothetical protein
MSLRFSVSRALVFVALVALGIAALLHASSPWADVVFTADLGLLVLAPLAAAYRRAAERASWAGLALCGWAYLLASTDLGPASIRPRLVTTKLLAWGYTWSVPRARQTAMYEAGLRGYIIPNPVVGEGLDPAHMHVAVDVLTKVTADTPPSTLASGLPVVGASTSRGKVTRVTVQADRLQSAAFDRALAAGQAIILVRNRPGPFSGLWGASPVSATDFERVGHAWLVLPIATIGSVVGRYLYGSRQ